MRRARLIVATLCADEDYRPQQRPPGAPPPPSLPELRPGEVET